MPGNRENKGLKKEGVSLIYDTPSLFFEFILLYVLYVSDNLSYTNLLVFAVAVESADLLYSYAALFCDRTKRFAWIHLVVELLVASRQFVVSSHFAAVNLLSGVTTVANLAAGSIGIS